MAIVRDGDYQSLELAVLFVERKVSSRPTPTLLSEFTNSNRCSKPAKRELAGEHMKIETIVATALMGTMASQLPAELPKGLILIPPCRVADTREANGPLGGPAMTAGETRTFPIPAGVCNIPRNAAAYSLNVTVVPHEPFSHLTMWPTGQPMPYVSTLNANEGHVVANGAIVTAGINGEVSIYVTGATDVFLDVNGYFAAPTWTNGNTVFGGSAGGNVGNNNTSVGSTALQSGSGSQNTAIGANTLTASSGSGNVGVGYAALEYNTTGFSNTGVGEAALFLNTSGSNNTALGNSALFHNQTAWSNTAIGANALTSNTTGSYNTAIGAKAGWTVSTGDYNIAIGFGAGYNATGSYNIEIGNAGQSNDTNVIRIGDPVNHTSTYIAGIANTVVAGSAVVIDPSTGQLGTIQSSARYKEDIHEMAGASEDLMRLHPVIFRYRQAMADGSKPMQYGLIAEEVARVYPELVVLGKDRQVESVQYQALPAMLLNELQKQHRVIQQQEQMIQSLRDHLATLETSLQQGPIHIATSIH